MNRPIKFRAYNRVLKQMRQVLCLEMEPKEFPQTSTRTAIYTVFDHPCVHTALIKARFAKWPEYDCDLIEFTGLHDKHGKEIYELDVVQWTDNQSDNPGKGFVVWHKEYCRFNIAWATDLSNYLESGFHGSVRFMQPRQEMHASQDWIEGPLEVIGNIVEHSHLLEAK